MFFSSDSEIHLKKSIKYFSIGSDDLSQPKARKSPTKKIAKKQTRKSSVSLDCLMNPSGRNKPKDRYRIQSIIKFLSKSGKSITNDYDNWYKVALAIANTFTHDIGEKYYLKLCKLDGAKYNEGDCRDMLRYCYASTQGEINFKTIYYFAKQQGYKIEGESSSEGGQNQEVSDGVPSISVSEDLVAQ